MNIFPEPQYVPTLSDKFKYIYREKDRIHEMEIVLENIEYMTAIPYN